MIRSKNLAIITARGGSKRIPGKNIKPFRGIPAIAYAITAAKKCDSVDKVMVSTDDLEIKKVAESYGAVVPFLRSAETSGDIAGTPEVILEVLHRYEDLGEKFENICVIFPTSVFLTPDLLDRSYEKLIEGSFDSVFPAIRYSHPIDRSFQIDKYGKAHMRWPENMNLRTQDIAPSFHDAGQFYWLKASRFLKYPDLFTKNSALLELDEFEAHDIDNEIDWEVAEFKHTFKYPEAPDFK
jgi:N-acylneuraminate cytidylyltransferase